MSFRMLFQPIEEPEGMIGHKAILLLAGLLWRGMFVITLLLYLAFLLFLIYRKIFVICLYSLFSFYVCHACAHFVALAVRLWKTPSYLIVILVIVSTCNQYCPHEINVLCAYVLLFLRLLCDQCFPGVPFFPSWATLYTTFLNCHRSQGLWMTPCPRTVVWV